MTKKVPKNKSPRRRHGSQFKDQALALAATTGVAAAAIKQAVFEYIEVDYNRLRQHTTVGSICPDAFEALSVV